jgi:hypothetical protein
MRVATKCATVLTALSLTVSAGAQVGPRMPGTNGILHPAVGAGAVYEDQGPEQGATATEVYVVGKEDFQGQTAYWIETCTHDRRGDSRVMKMLMILEGSNAGAKRVIMSINGRFYEIRADPTIGQMAKTSPHDILNDKSVVRVGTETVTVPAGTYSCEHYRASDSSWDVWVSDKISPWGLVKSISKGSTRVLVRQITDAQTKITGPVEVFDPTKMVQPKSRP